MKPKKQPNGAKKPMIRWMHDEIMPSQLSDSYTQEGEYCVLVLPLPTKRAALELLKLLPAILALLDNPAKKKWDGLSYGEKVERIAKAFEKKRRDVLGYGGNFRKLTVAEKANRRIYARVFLSLTGEPSP